MVDLLKNNYDIVILGAGPGGVSAGFFSKYFDQENKLKVLLIERLSDDKYSTYHDICGGCIGKNAFKEIYPIKPQNIIEKLNTIEEHYVSEYILKGRIDGYIIDRPRFFSNIINDFIERGGEFQKASINKISKDKKGIKLQTNNNDIIKTKYLIGSDGANSLVRKSFKFGTFKTTIATQYIVDEEPEHGVLKFYYDEKYKGDYKWIFPNNDSKRIGMPFIRGEKFTPDKKIIKKQTRVIGSGRMEKYVIDNILLIGDAAGQTNPISKGGIRPAMYAGKKAAESLVKYNNPLKYETDWKNSAFHNNNMNAMFDKIKKMTNEEIVEHMEPFKNNLITATFKILLSKKYKRYKDIYKAYRFEQKYGW